MTYILSGLSIIRPRLRLSRTLSGSTSHRFPRRTPMNCSSLVDFVSLRATQGALGERERDVRNLVKAHQGRVPIRNHVRTISADLSAPSPAPLRARACGTGSHLYGAKSDRGPETYRHPSLPKGAVVVGHQNPSPSMVRSAKPIPLRYCPPVSIDRSNARLSRPSAPATISPDECFGIPRLSI